MFITRIADTLDVPEGYVFGVMVQPDEYGAGKLLQMQLPSSFDSTQRNFNVGLLSTVRQHLKQNNFHSLEALMDAFQQKDKVMTTAIRPFCHLTVALLQENTGTISGDVVQEICFQFRVPLEQDMLEMLMRWCRAESDPSLVHYPLLIQFMNWKSIPPSDKLNSTTIGSIPSLQLASKLASTTLRQETPGDKVTTTTAGDKDQAASATVVPDQTATSSDDVTKQAPLLVHSPTNNYRTSSQTIGATVGNISNNNYPTCGVPTIRSDKAAPRIKRVSDNTVSK